MREILFRGIDERYALAKGYRENVWRYGSLQICDNGDNTIGSCQASGHITFSSKVIPETVGQYVEILNAYEGDILSGYDDYDGETGETAYWYGVVKFDEEAGRIRIFGDDSMWYEVDDFNFDEIAGNIYDNPELLEEWE
jgi:hypothetical protein